MLPLVPGASGLAGNAAPDELATQRVVLAQLEERWADNHPGLHAQRLRVALWERVTAEAPGRPATVQEAIVELGVLESRHLERSPTLLIQRARVTALLGLLERVPHAPADLLAVHADLAAARVVRQEAHPGVVDLKIKLAAYERHLLDPNPTSLPLRLARAQYEHLSHQYGPNHPRLMELKERIKVLEAEGLPHEGAVQ